MRQSVRLLALALGSRAGGEELADATYSAWRERILPRAEETAFREVGWRPVFWSAVMEAQREEKPILLWAMNGHPLACT